MELTMFRSIFIFAMLSVSFLLEAKISTTDFERCKKIENSPKRLHCFDNIKSIDDITVQPSISETP